MTEAIAAAGGTALVASEGGRLVAAVERAGGRHVRLPLASKNPAAIWLKCRPPRPPDPDRERRHHPRPIPRACLVRPARGPSHGARFVTTYHGVTTKGCPASGATTPSWPRANG